MMIQCDGKKWCLQGIHNGRYYDAIEDGLAYAADVFEYKQWITKA